MGRQSSIVDIYGKPIELDFAGESTTPAIAGYGSDPDYTATTVYMPNPDATLAKMGEKIAVYDSMMDDAKVWSSFEKLCDGAKRYKYEVRQGKLDDKTYQIIKDYFDTMKWNLFVESVLRARLYGYQPIEIVWEDRDGVILPKALEVRPQSRFVFKAEDGSPLLITKDEKDGIWKPEWDNSFIFPKYHATKSPYGTAVLSKCFWNVVAKRAGVKWWMTFLEKYGTPWLLMFAGQNATDDDMKKLAAAGEKAIRTAVLVMKEGNRTEIVESTQKSQSTDAHKSFIDFHNEEIGIAITSENLTSTNNGAGSYAASQTAESILDTAINSCVELITETAEELTRKIITVNTGVFSVVTFNSYDPQYINMGLVQRDKVLKEIGVNFTPEYVAREHKLQLTDFTMVSTEAAPPTPEPITPEAKVEFAGKTDMPPDQVEIDRLGDSVFKNSELNQKLLKKMTEPVMDFVSGADSFEDAEKKLAKIYPKMDSKGIQTLVYKLLATARIVGEMSAGNEE